jgi:hypothetical protein
MSRLSDLENVMVGPWGSGQNPLAGPVTQTIVAGVNAFAYPITVTDAVVAAMVNITPPYPTFCGEITIIPGAAFTWTAAGNIAVAGTAVVGKPVKFLYLPTTGKWYSSY